MNRIFRELDMKLSVYVVDSGFNIDLLIVLSKIKDIIMEVEFRYKHRRVQELVDKYRPIIRGFSG